MKSGALRKVALVAGAAVLFCLLPWLVLKLAGYTLAVFPAAGDRSQTEVVDLTFHEAPPPVPSVTAGAPVRNIVFLLADGLGFSQLYAARLAAHGAHGRLLLERFPVTGWQTNPSVDDIYTDSAASASALYTGSKTNTMALSMDAAGRPLTTLAETLKENGFAVGLMTDSYLWDASIAAHAVHHDQRYDMLEVARQLPLAGFDLLAGRRPEDDDLRGDVDGGIDALIRPLTEAGYAVVDDPPTLPAWRGPTALLYSGDQIVDGHPSLSQLAAWALAELSADGRPLFLFVETEEPDTGSHLHDFARVRRGLLELDAVAQKALEFAAGRNDTLILATGDHETGGFSILSGSADEPLAIRWATTHHTASPVPIMAWGAGAERFGGVLDNTEIATRLKQLALDSQDPGSPPRPPPG